MLRKKQYSGSKPRKGPGYSPSPPTTANSCPLNHQNRQSDGHIQPEQDKIYERAYDLADEENGGIVVTTSFGASSGRSA